MKTFAIGGRCIDTLPPADWREQLTRMLGTKPRRIGTWAELGLYGALSCMADAREKTLPPDAQIWLGSRRGTYAATDIVLGQMREDLPMPLAFLQTQPSQLLALLAAQLQWQGHACFVAGGEYGALLRLAAAQTGKDGILLGWLDETLGGETRWLRLRPCVEVKGDYIAAKAETLFSSQISHLRLSGNRLDTMHSGRSVLEQERARC
jgi:hypothetical protein